MAGHQAGDKPLSKLVDTQFLIYTTLDINTLRLRQNGHHVSDDIFKCIFLNGNVWISLKIWLKFVPKV